MLLPLGLLALVGLVLLVLFGEVVHVVHVARVVFIVVVVVLVVALVAHVVVDLLWLPIQPVLRGTGALTDSSANPSAWPRLGLTGVALTLGVASTSDSASNASAYSATYASSILSALIASSSRRYSLSWRCGLSGPRVAFLFLGRC